MNPNSITRGKRVDLSLFQGFDPLSPLAFPAIVYRHASKSLAPLSLSFCRVERRQKETARNWRVEGEA